MIESLINWQVEQLVICSGALIYTFLKILPAGFLTF